MQSVRRKLPSATAGRTADSPSVDAVLPAPRVHIPKLVAKESPTDYVRDQLFGCAPPASPATPPPGARKQPHACRDRVQQCSPARSLLQLKRWPDAPAPTAHAPE